MIRHTDEILWSLLDYRHKLDVSVDLPTQTSAAVADEMNLKAVLDNLQATAFHLLGEIDIVVIAVAVVAAAAAAAGSAADGDETKLVTLGHITNWRHRWLD